MLNTLKELFANQYEASFCMLNACIERCSESAWNALVGETLFCQVAFHTLLFADCYLGSNEAEVRQQPFHLSNKEFFRDYEELEDRIPKLLYDKPSIQRYLEYCRHKAVQAIATETAEMLRAPCGFPYRPFSRAELHVYNIRHIQNHAAQLGLRLTIDHHLEIPWVGSGWRAV